MNMVAMDSIKLTLQYFYQSLSDSNARLTFDKHMQGYRQRMADWGQDFYTITIHDPALQALIFRILAGLGVPARQCARFYDAPITVYEWLRELQQLTESNRVANERVKQFMRAIERFDRTKQRLALAVMIGSVVLLSFLPAFLSSGGMTLVQTVLAASLTLPLGGLLYTIGVAAYSFYQKIKDKRLSWKKKFHDNFFLLANLSLNVAAYSLLIAAAASTTPLAAILFIVASIVNVLKEISNLVQSYLRGKTAMPLGQENSLQSRERELRRQFDMKKSRCAITLELLVATLYVGMIVAWMFIPASIVVSIAMVSAISVLMLAKYVLTSYFDKRITRERDMAFAQLETESSLPLVSSKLLYNNAADEDAVLEPEPSSPVSVLHAKSRPLQAIVAEPAPKLPIPETPEVTEEEPIPVRLGNCGLFAAHRAFVSPKQCQQDFPLSLASFCGR